MNQPVLFNVSPLSPNTANKDPFPPSEFRYIENVSEFAPFVPKLADSPVLGLDTETTGLDPFADRVRLLQIAAPGLPVLVLDLFRIADVEPIRRVLSSPGVKVLQNAKFDLKFLTRTELPVGGQIFDTMLAGQVIGSGRRGHGNSLAELVGTYLNRSLSKEERLSDWSARELSEEQLRYAATDAGALLPLREAMIAALKSAGLVKCAKIEFDCVRAVADMELSGISLDLDRWNDLRKSVEATRDRLAVRLREEFGSGFLGEINLDSPAQIVKALAKRGLNLSSTSRWALAKYNDRDDVRLFQEYRKASKLCGSFLATLPNFINPRTGRLHPVYEQAIVVSGRFSCHSPNLQQLPHDQAFRACFVAEPGNRLVIADYSQIELRAAAQYGHDERMTQAYRTGTDLHLLTAALISGKPIESVGKADRQAAKAVNFGLLYGQGARGLKNYAKQSYGVEMTMEDAERFRERFFQAYDGITAWHRRTARDQARIRETRTLVGRRRLLDKPLDLPTLLNLPVQGTAADILKSALGKLVSRLPEYRARIVGCVHDEILLEVPIETADAAAVLLTETMEAAGNEILDQVPVVAESRVCLSWAEKA